jgi:hypothetical protein
MKIFLTILAYAVTILVLLLIAVLAERWFNTPGIMITGWVTITGAKSFLEKVKKTLY